MEVEDEVNPDLRNKEKDIVTLVARICDPVTGVSCVASLNGTNIKNSKKRGKDKILKSFSGKELITWILGNTKASNRHDACNIGQSLIDAGFLIEPNNGTSMTDDDTMFRVPKEKQEEVKGVFRHSPSKPTTSRYAFIKSRNGGLFGCDLGELLARERREIPSFLVSMISYLDTEEVLNTEGIFRIAPNAVELARLKDVLDNSDGPIDFESFNFKTPHVVTGLLKAWLRQMKIPLAHPFESFSPLAEQVIPQKRINVCRQLIEKLPRGYAITLDYLTGFLHRVTAHSVNNKMSYKNLASVVGPNILRRPSPSPLSLLKDMNDANVVVSLFIEEYATIFVNVGYVDDYKAQLLGWDSTVPRTVLDAVVFVPPPAAPLLTTVSLGVPEENPRTLTRKASMLMMQRPDPPPPKLEKRPEILASTFEGIKISELLFQMVSPGGVKIKNRKHHLKTYRNVAVGSKMVDWLCKKYNWKRDKCVELIQQIMEAGYIQATPYALNFKDGHFYVFLVEELHLEIPSDATFIVQEEDIFVPPIRLKRVPNPDETKSPKLSPRNSEIGTFSPKNSGAATARIPDTTSPRISPRNVEPGSFTVRLPETTVTPRNLEDPVSPRNSDGATSPRIIGLRNFDNPASPRNRRLPASARIMESGQRIPYERSLTEKKEDVVDDMDMEKSGKITERGGAGSGKMEILTISEKLNSVSDGEKSVGMKQLVKRSEKSKVPKINFGANLPMVIKSRPNLTARIERGRSEGVMQKRRNKLMNKPDQPQIALDEKSEVHFKQLMTNLMDTAEGWLVVGYKTTTVLQVQAQGDGSIEKLVQVLKDDEVQYALVRLSFVEGEVQHTRNVFIIWVGPNVLPFEKGRKRTHTGKISQMFQPFHAELSAISKQNFTRERVLKLIGTNGTHTID